MQKARRHLAAPTACRHAVSGSLSLPSPGFFSPFPHGTGSLSVIEEYLALADGPAGFPPGFTCPVVLGDSARSLRVSPTGLSPSLDRPSSPFDYTRTPKCTPHNPFDLAVKGLGCSDFARHYFRNHFCFLFLRVLRWFNSPGSLTRSYVFTSEFSLRRGLPHSDIPGSKPVRRLPEAFRSLPRPSSLLDA
jgi:hypothetical protein